MRPENTVAACWNARIQMGTRMAGNELRQPDRDFPLAVSDGGSEGTLNSVPRTCSSFPRRRGGLLLT